jgi:NADP-reducing hydrogenase subunit HndB
MTKTSRPCITIATGSCGRAAGADDTVEAFLCELQRLGVDGVTVRKVGCAGLCEVEPLVAVKLPDQDEVVYGRVDADAAKQIVAQHIVNGRVIAHQALEGVVFA